MFDCGQLMGDECIRSYRGNWKGRAVFWHLEFARTVGRELWFLSGMGDSDLADNSQHVEVSVGKLCACSA